MQDPGRGVAQSGPVPTDCENTMNDPARESDPPTPRRRIFLKQVATVVGATPLALGGAATASAASATASAPSQAASIPHAWRFFNGGEARAVEAAVARLIPADDEGPGAM